MHEIPDRYTLIETLEGGFGKVFICMDTQLERKVAIKFIKDEKQSFRLIDELQALMKIRSKHVVQLYDIIRDKDNQIGLIQEFVDGSNIEDFDSLQASENDYLKIIWQIASGLSDIHEAGLIHRDIKLNNMKINAEGVLKIFDFGLSRTEGGNSRTNGFVGTLGFAAPELLVLGNQNCEFTHAVDTYAFGVTALCLAVGPTIRKVDPTAFDNISIIPQNINKLLKECLFPKPSDWPNINDVRDMLARYLLRDSHQAIAVYGSKQCYVLNKDKNAISLEVKDLCRIRIEYTGLCFVVASVEGNVYVNNAKATRRQEMPGSCVITLGQSSSNRTFIPFDVSNPEVVL